MVTEPSAALQPPNNGSEQKLPKSYPSESNRLLQCEFEETNISKDHVKKSSLPLTVNLFTPLEYGRLPKIERTSALSFDLGYIGTVTESFNKGANERTDLLRVGLENDTRSKLKLEATVSELENRVFDQEFSVLEKTNNEKSELLVTVHRRLSEVSQISLQDQQELAQKLKEADEEISQLEIENMGSKEQFSACQGELQTTLSKVSSSIPPPPPPPMPTNKLRTTPNVPLPPKPVSCNGGASGDSRVNLMDSIRKHSIEGGGLKHVTEEDKRSKGNTSAPTDGSLINVLKGRLSHLKTANQMYPSVEYSSSDDEWSAEDD